MTPPNLPLRPAQHTEEILIDRILSGHYPPGSTLPAERELALELGVTRPTLREALQRLSRDGLLEIRQGKPTLVCDPRAAGLHVLAHLATRAQVNHLIPDLLDLRCALLPHWVEAAVARPEASQELLEYLRDLPPQTASSSAALEYTLFDWGLQSAVARLSGNALAPLLLGSFRDVFSAAGEAYFSSAKRRTRTRRYYLDFRAAIQSNDAGLATRLARDVARDSVTLWLQAEQEGGSGV